MKKKSTEGGKKEARLRFRYRELKRAGKLYGEDGNVMTMSQFRKSEFNACTKKTVKIKTGSKKDKIVERIVKIFIPLKSLLEVKPKPKVEKPPKLSKTERRARRREIRHQILLATQFAKLEREERKLERERIRQEKMEAFLKEQALKVKEKFQSQLRKAA